MALIRRGEVWWTDFGPIVGSTPAGRRPSLVISADRFNDSNINTVVVAGLTSNVRLARRPGNLLLKAGTAGLPLDSVVNVSQVQTLDKRELDSCLGQVGKRVMEQVDAGLRMVLDL
jgi:mRNA interferase MazF